MDDLTCPDCRTDSIGDDGKCAFCKEQEWLDHLWDLAKEARS